MRRTIASPAHNTSNGSGKEDIMIRFFTFANIAIALIDLGRGGFECKGQFSSFNGAARNQQLLEPLQ
jgi:hypothetical protein